MKLSSSRQGFTLIQISILLTVAALVLVTLLPSIQTKSAHDGDTAINLNAVLYALREFQANHGRLPCPADATQATSASNYGVEAANPGTTNNCSSGTPAANYTDATNHIAIGMVPVRALGIANSYALDAYGRDITYAVDTNATVLGWSAASLTGQITVTDNGTANSTVAALVSHGADGHGAWIPLAGSIGTAVRLNAGSTDADQLTNAHVNASFTPTTTLTNFVKKAQTGTFDDLVVYKNPLWIINNIPASVAQISTVTPPANGTYTTGQALAFTLTYSKAVTVTGTPELTLTIGANTRYATYTGGTGTTALAFSYTVVSADSAPSGISMAGTVNMNGGSIMTGNAYSVLGLTAPNLSGVTVNVSSGGNLYIADALSSNVRKVNLTTGIITTVAGTGTSGYTGDGGQATAAKLENPFGVAVDNSGNIYISDQGAEAVRKVTASSGIITTVAGNGAGGAGSPATAAALYTPWGVAVDSSGNIYIGFNGDGTVVKVMASSGILNIYAGNTTEGYTGDGGQATAADLISSGIGIDSNGNIYVAGEHNLNSTENRVREVTASSGIITTVAGTGAHTYSGDGGQATAAGVALAYGVAVDSSGNIYIAEHDNRIRKVTASSGIITTIAGNGTAGYTGDGGQATAAEVSNPYDVAVDSSGNLYIADAGNSVIRKVTASSGIITTIAGNGTAGYSGDGGKASAAEINAPYGIIVVSR